ncbi:FHA domain-containing protein [Chloroflexota bacterium]
MNDSGDTTHNRDLSDAAEAQEPRWGTARFDQHVHSVLRFTQNNSVFKIDAHQPEGVIIGRRDSSGSAPPAVDLTSLEANQHGISRQHARIEVRDNTLRITDLGSTNGTRVNNVPLVPHMTALIRDGDEISLGQLKCLVFFVNKSTR